MTFRSIDSSLVLSCIHCASNTSCSVTIPSCSSIAPLRTRLNSCMCAPTPNSSPRWTHNVRIYVPASQLTQKTPRCLSLSNSNSLLSWMVRMRSCLLTADIKGGRWKRAPVRVSSDRASCASPPGSLSCRRITQTYSFPAPCCDLTRRVARSRQTIKQPVTLGSRVPLCPVFSILCVVSRLSQGSWIRCIPT